MACFAWRSRPIRRVSYCAETADQREFPNNDYSKMERDN
jgi:hypothetical protein